MSASRNSFKFTLKPSSLSQHTANFNKILEQVPVPKIEPLELVKPIEIKLETQKKEENNQENKSEKENTQTETTPVKEFIFGEKLTDRVVNVAEPEADSNSKAEEDTQNSQNSVKSDSDKTNEQKPLWSTTENEADQIENNEANTIFKLNCKLFVLDTDKAKWNERGYGILKVIDSNDGFNCKIMMWTDKCFRLILNTKFFEKMQLDRANQKSIRFNAYDNGSIRIFLVKTGNPNDCDELYSLLEKRFNDYLAHLELTKQDTNVNKSTPPKDVLFRCACKLAKKSSETSHSSEIHLYQAHTTAADSQSTSNPHHLMLDIVENDTIHLTTFLKFVKIATKTKPFEFEIQESLIKQSNSSQLNYKITIDDEDMSQKFLAYYEKEPKYHVTNESSNESSNVASSSDESESETESSQRNREEKTHSSQQLDSSNLDEEEVDEESEDKKQLNKKRKTAEEENTSSEELNKKAFKKSEQNTSDLNESDLKRANQDEQDSLEAKKSKVSEEDSNQ